MAFASHYVIKEKRKKPLAFCNKNFALRYYIVRKTKKEVFGMKKFFAILLALVLLGSCSVKPEEPAVPEEPVSRQPEEKEEPKEKPVDKNNFEPADHSYLIFVREETNGTKIVWTCSEEGEAKQEEVPDTLYYLEDKNGNPLVDHPFCSYAEYCYENLVSVEPEIWKHCCEIEGDYDGNYYRYLKNDAGVYVLDYALTKYEKEFGEYIEFGTFGKYGGTGLKDKQGNIVLPPVYGKIYMPFSDRIIARHGVPHALETQREYLLDENLNFLSAPFNSIRFYSAVGGGYIGVALRAGENAEMPCYDGDGNPMEEGRWFINENGKIISENFEDINIEWIREEEGEGAPAILLATGKTTVKPIDGEETEISIKDYIWYK